MLLRSVLIVVFGLTAGPRLFAQESESPSATLPKAQESAETRPGAPSTAPDASDAAAETQAPPVVPATGDVSPPATSLPPTTAVPPANSEPVEKPATRGMIPDAESRRPAYLKRRAVIIGIDYHAGDAATRVVRELKNAENDAQAFHKLLTNHYGFDEANTTLLLGKAATKASIEKAIAEQMIEGVTDGDCVLLYFSGHGFARPDASGRFSAGELLPYDVEGTESAPSLAHVVQMEELVNRLGKHSRARHKLLILDCCHSGAVFSQDGRRAGQFDALRVDDSLFRSHGFQAMTASRPLQQAGDSAKRSVNSSEAPEDHSPFTSALLNALKYLAAMKGEGATLTTTQVFSGMQLYLDSTLPDNQSPQCSWLDAGQGEFHFLLEGSPPERELPNEQVRRNMIAMVPGSFGNWWFDECPWFLPGLRSEIVADTPESRSTNLEVISPRQLEDAARQMRRRLRDDPSLGDDWKHRLNYMDRLMSGTGEDWTRTRRSIVTELQERKDRSERPGEPATSRSARAGEPATVEKQGLPAVDLHLLAVLRHSLRDDVEEAANCYEKAIAQYREDGKASRHNRALLAMCLADYGWFEVDVLREFDRASQHFAEARRIYGAATPQPFLVYVLCRDAEALLRLGREGAADQRLAEALGAIREVDPQERFPLSAAYYHRRAWLRMQSCKFTAAAEDFDKSTAILKPLLSDKAGDESGGSDANTGIEAQVVIFHNEHGEAMANRFLGDRDVALRQYRALYSEIADTFISLRKADGRETNYRQTKARLVERLVNTQERLGDCSLFGQPTDAAEAVDDYRRAIRSCGYLPPERRNRFEQKIRYKYALALALPGTSVHDPELAREQLRLLQSPSIEPLSEKREAGSDLPQTESPTTPTVTKSEVAPDHPHLTARGDMAISERSIQICSQMIELLLALEPNRETTNSRGASLEDPMKILSRLRKDLDAFLEDERLNRSLTRDDIEAALFCMKIILDDLKTPIAGLRDEEGRSPRLLRHHDLDLLLGFCRSARRGGVESLPFSRPYYDCAIRTLIDLKPPHSKQLIEIAYEALNGEIHRKAADPEISLVVYNCTPVSYIFLDVPRATSRHFPLSGSIDAAAIQKAIRENQKLKLPPEVYKELSLAAITQWPVVACWHDPVLKIGQTVGTRVTTARPTFASAEPASPDLTIADSLEAVEVEGFPFEVPVGVIVRPSNRSQPALNSLKID